MNNEKLHTEILIPRHYLTRILRMLSSRDEICFRAYDSFFKVTQETDGLYAEIEIAGPVECKFFTGSPQESCPYRDYLNPKPLLDWLETIDRREDRVVIKAYNTKTTITVGESVYTFDRYGFLHQS